MLKFQAEITDMLVLAEITVVPAGCIISPKQSSGEDTIDRISL